MNTHQRVEGHSNLVRDRRTGAILNTNKTEIERARKLRTVQQEKEQHIIRLTNEVDTLRDDVTQIKELLFRLLEDKK
jgi:hypothetical protein